MTIERAHRILGRGYTREEARRLLTACGLLLDAAESALAVSPSLGRAPLPCPAGHEDALSHANPCPR